MAKRKPDHRVHRYAADVVSGAIVAGPLVRLACERHQRDRARKDWRFGFDAATADHALAFFEQVLRLPDADDAEGTPRPFLLSDWQAFIIGSIFGWCDTKTGLRRFREVYCEIGKGNGKTPLAAGIGLYGLLMDGETAAEVYSAATDRDQAKICWTDAQRMVDRSGLSDEDAPLVHKSVNNLSHGFSFFRPLSSEHKGLDGKRPHVVITDELHEHPSGLVVNKLRAGAKGRKQPIFVEITNSGFDRTSICWEHHEHSRRILEGTIEDEQWFAYVCALDEEDDPLSDPTCWVKANPNLGVSIQEEYIARQVQNARNIPAETNTVLRLNFCVWTQANTRFFDMMRWQACGERVVTDDALAGVTGYGGLDLGQSDDFAAFVMVFPMDDGTVAVRCRFWLPEGALEKYPNRPYAQWQRAQVLEVTEGDMIDLDRIEDEIEDLTKRYGVAEVGYDKRFSQQLAMHLEGRGLTMVDVPQGFYLNESIKRINEWVVAGDLAHGAHPVLTWMADNSVVRHGRNMEVRLDKEKARDKIDGIAALANATSRLLVQDTGPSVYETRGVVRL